MKLAAERCKDLVGRSCRLARAVTTKASAYEANERFVVVQTHRGRFTLKHAGRDAPGAAGCYLHGVPRSAFRVAAEDAAELARVANALDTAFAHFRGR